MLGGVCQTNFAVDSNAFVSLRVLSEYAILLGLSEFATLLGLADWKTAHLE